MTSSIPRFVNSLLGRRAGFLLGLAGVSLLAACAAEPERRPCPQAVVLTDASRQVKFSGPGRDLTDVLFEASIQAGQLVCEYDENVLDVDLQVQVVAQRGPANGDRLANISYFVAVARTDQTVLARENFGCGSSREHAPWALLQHGFQAVIAPSFADIFHNNSFKNGLLLIRLDAETVDRLFKQVHSTEGFRVAVDLEQQTVTTPAGEILKFEVDPFHKHCLLNGLDEIGLTLEHADAIKAFEDKHRKSQPWLFS